MRELVVWEIGNEGCGVGEVMMRCVVREMVVGGRGFYEGGGGGGVISIVIDRFEQ